MLELDKVQAGAVSRLTEGAPENWDQTERGLPAVGGSSGGPRILRTLLAGRYAPDYTGWDAGLIGPSAPVLWQGTVASLGARKRAT